MAFFDKPLSRITENDLQTLRDNKEPEGKRIDYKRDAVGQGDSDKKEFLYDASSFANTQGGYLILGMAESRGVPTDLVGLGGGIDPDKEILRLEQMLRDGIRPPISGIETVSVSLTSGNIAVVLRIPKSWNPPHQVTFQKAFRFYARDSNGKYQIDVDELRSIFSLSGMVAERIRQFRMERIAKIVGGDAPVTLLDGGILVLHIVPFSAFGVGASFPLREVVRVPNRFPPLANTLARNFQMTFDGLLTTSNAESPPAPQRAYTQVMRTGNCRSSKPRNKFEAFDLGVSQMLLEARTLAPDKTKPKSLRQAAGAIASTVLLSNSVGVARSEGVANHLFMHQSTVPFANVDEVDEVLKRRLFTSSDASYGQKLVTA